MWIAQTQVLIIPPPFPESLKSRRESFVNKYYISRVVVRMSLPAWRLEGVTVLTAVD